MRRLVLVVALLALIGGGLLLAAALSLNRVIAHNRERILQQAEAALGREVSADTITVSLWGGIGARLENVRIADDARFSEADFFQATAVTARARLWPLLRGQFEVGRIDAKQPQVHLVRDAAGRWNYTTLKPLSPQARAAASSTRPTLMHVAAVAAVQPEPLPLMIGRATIEDGSLVVTDRSQEPAQTTRVDHINLALTDISMTTPIRFSLDTALQADVSNVRLRGSVGPLQSRDAIPLELNGDLGPFGAQELRIDDLHLKAAVTADSVRLSQIDGHGFGGSFSLNGQYPTHRNGQTALKGKLKDIAIAKVLQLTMKDAAKQIEGAGQLSVDLHAAGNSAETIQSSLTGDVAADIHDGAIKDFNLVNEVLGRVTGLPGISSLVSATVKPKYGRLFSEANTRFQQLHGTFQIAEQRIRTEDLAVIATDYGVRANGWISFNRVADLSGTLLMSKQFSSDVVADVKEARYLVDNNGQLAVPFRLRGRVGEAKPEPDTDQLAEILTRALARGGAEHLLDKLLGGKRRNQPPPAGDEPRNPIEQGLRDLLGR